MPRKLHATGKLCPPSWGRALILLGLAFFGGPATTLAQEIGVVAALRLDRREPKPLWFEYVAADGGLVTLSYLSKNSSREIGLFKYDADFKRTWRRAVFDNTREREIAYLTVQGETIFIFTHERDFRDREERTYYYAYDLLGNALVTHQPLHAAPFEDGTYDFDFARSINKRWLLGYYDAATRRAAERIDFFLFGTEADTNLSGSLTLPYPDEDLQIKTVEIANDGTIFLLCKLLEGARERSPNDARFLVFKYDPFTRQLKEIPFQLEGKFITDLQLKVDRENKLLLGGFYSLRNASQVLGMLYARLDTETDSFLVRNTQAFNDAVLSHYLKERQIERGQELSNFYLDDFVLRTDGGLLLLAEQYYVTQTSYRNINGFWSTQNQYHYDDILVVSVSPEGGIEWVTPVIKRQVADSPVELSYTHYVAGEYIYLLYKEHRRGTGTNVYFRTVNAAGELSKPVPFFPDFRVNDQFYRGASEQLSNTEGLLVVYQVRERVFSMLKLAL